MSRGTGCDCPDRQYRGAGCCHELACCQLCAEYRELKAKAERGETVRPSTALLQAIRWPMLKNFNTPGCRECGAPTDFDICSGCFFMQQGAA